jgi:hypothetical protein
MILYGWKESRSRRRLRRLKFEVYRHFLQRQVESERSQYQIVSLTVGFFLAMVYVLTPPYSTGFYLYFLFLGIGLIAAFAHFVVMTFFWKVKLLDQIRFKSKFLPVDEKLVYRIKTSTISKGPLFNLYFESYYGMTKDAQIKGSEKLKDLCFYLIDDVRHKINASDKKFADLSSEQKDLLNVEWTIDGGNVGKFNFAGSYPHTQSTWWYVFYSIVEKTSWESPQNGCKVKCIVLTEPECYLLELAVDHLK